MSFLLDTNVISEWVKPAPDPNVIDWLAAVDEDQVYLSVAAFAEIRRGIELLPQGKKRDRLATWLETELATRFEGRIVEIDQRIAESWGILMARSQALGTNLRTLDAFFAATAVARGLILVTRNVKDFAGLGLLLYNPWEPDAPTT